MISHSEGYNPSSDIRQVGMRITIGMDSGQARENAYADLSDYAFTDDSDAAKLFDGDITTTAVTTNDSNYSKYLYVHFSSDYPPSYLKVYFAQDSAVPDFIMTRWYKSSSESSPLWTYPTENDKVLTFQIPAGYASPSYMLFSIQGSGIKICEMELAPPVSDIVLTEQEIISAKIEEEVDIYAERLPGRSLYFEAAMPADVSDPVTLGSCTGKSVKSEISINGEYVHTGDFYIDEIAAADGGIITKVSCSDIVTRMEKFITGLSTGGAKTLGEILNYGSGAAAYLDFQMDDYSAQSLICADMYTEVDTQKNCLLKAAQAARLSSIWVNRSGVVRISCLTKQSGSVAQIHPNDVIEYSEYGLDDRVDYVEVTGENSSGITAATSGKYYRACIMEYLENDFFVPQNGEIIADNYIAAKNYRLNASLKLRCDPCIEAADRVRLYWKDSNDLGEFIVTKQVINFDSSGLWSQMRLTASPGAE